MEILLSNFMYSEHTHREHLSKNVGNEKKIDKVGNNDKVSYGY